MTVVRVELEPDRSSAGQPSLIVRLKGIWLVPPRLALRIEPVDTRGSDGLDGWPAGEILPRANRVTPAGIELLVGPDAFAAVAVQPGTPVVVEVPALEIREELIWPEHLPDHVPEDFSGDLADHFQAQPTQTFDHDEGGAPDGQPTRETDSLADARDAFARAIAAARAVTHGPASSPPRFAAGRAQRGIVDADTAADTAAITAALAAAVGAADRLPSRTWLDEERLTLARLQRHKPELADVHIVAERSGLPSALPETAAPDPVQAISRSAALDFSEPEPDVDRTRWVLPFAAGLATASVIAAVAALAAVQSGWLPPSTGISIAATDTTQIATRMTEERDAATAAATAAQTAVRTAQAGVASARSRISDLERELSQRDARLASLEREAAELTTRLASAEKTGAEAVARIAAGSQAATEGKAETERLASEVQALRADLSEATATVTARSTALDSARGDVERLTSELASVRERLAAAEKVAADTTELRKAAERAADARAAAEDTLQRLRTELASVKLDLSDAIEGRKALETALAAQRRPVASVPMPAPAPARAPSTVAAPAPAPVATARTTAVAPDGTSREVTLRLKSGALAIEGELRSFDGRTYIIASKAYGTVSFDAGRFECAGPGCP